MTWFAVLGTAVGCYGLRARGLVAACAPRRGRARSPGSGAPATRPARRPRRRAGVRRRALARARRTRRRAPRRRHRRCAARAVHRDRRRRGRDGGRATRARGIHRAMSSATVVGAGVFGAATARELALRGWDVTLVEQYTPGNVRSGSGGDTRLSRAAHGSVEWYTRLVAPCAHDLARPAGGDGHAHLGAGRCCVVRTAGRTGSRQQSRGDARAPSACPVRVAEPRRRARPLPLARDGATCMRCCFEPEAGVTARAARDAAARRGRRAPRRAARARRALAGPIPLAADVVVWACGSWLPQFFPGRRRAEDLAPRRLLLRHRRVVARARRASASTTRRSTATARSPGSAPRSRPTCRARPSIRTRSTGCRRASSEQVARDYAAHRFPAARARRRSSAARVCQYDLTADTHFVFDRHPEHAVVVAARRRLGARLQARPGPRASTSPTASRAAPSPSRSTRSARAAATPACAPPPSAEPVRTAGSRGLSPDTAPPVCKEPLKRGRNGVRSGLQRRNAPQGRAARRVPRRPGRRAARARLGVRQAPGRDVDPRRRQLHEGEPRQEADPHDRHPRDRRRLATRQRLVALRRPLARVRALRDLARRLDRAARAPLRHRLARRQLEDERPLHRHRARRRDLRPGRLHERRVHSLGEARRLARPALRHPGRPQAHHRPLAGAGPERSRRSSAAPTITPTPARTGGGVTTCASSASSRSPSSTRCTSARRRSRTATR